jgi:uncharacterized protein YcbK (DUF882 family)
MTLQRDAFASVRAEYSRRRFMQLLFFSGLTVFSPPSILASIRSETQTEKSLFLYNPHTKETFCGIYRRNGEYLPQALENINRIMRDTRTGRVKAIDKHLLNLLHDLSMKLKAQDPFHVISGYRTPKSNAKLRKQGRGAAKNSYHLKGKAADIRLPGYRTSVLRRAACEMKKGGVGFYPRLKFVHVDVGPVRYWKGNR